MGRVLMTAIVVGVDVLWLGPARLPEHWWTLSLLAVAIALVLWWRRGVPGFALAGAISAVTGGAYALLVCLGYRAGQQAESRRDVVVVAVGMAGYLGLNLALDPGRFAQTAVASLLLIVLPMTIGRYLAQHRRLVAALDERNRRLRYERELLAERERLTERLRIARDMHDSIGHRLSLLSVQAAALEVGDLPPREAAAIRRLASTARQATTELHDLVGALRQPEDGPMPGPELDGLTGLAAEFRAAGLVLDLVEHGDRRPVDPPVAQAAFRVVEEGLSNAVKHAAGAPVEVSLRWETDALLVTVRNPLTGASAGDSGGHGLAGLAERVALAGGLLHHELSTTDFRVSALLPLVPEPEPRSLAWFRRAALAAGVVAVVALAGPMSMLTGSP